MMWCWEWGLEVEDSDRVLAGRGCGKRRDKKGVSNQQREWRRLRDRCHDAASM